MGRTDGGSTDERANDGNDTHHGGPHCDHPRHDGCGCDCETGASAFRSGQKLKKAAWITRKGNVTASSAFASQSCAAYVGGPDGSAPLTAGMSAEKASARAVPSTMATATFSTPFAGCDIRANREFSSMFSTTMLPNRNGTGTLTR